MPAYKVKEYNGVKSDASPDWDYIMQLDVANEFLLWCRSKATEAIKLLEPDAEVKISDFGLKIGLENYQLPSSGWNGIINAMREAAEAIAIAEGQVDGWYWNRSYDYVNKNDEKSGLGYDFSDLPLEQKKKRFLKLISAVV
jgi:hypothetical protein